MIKLVLGSKNKLTKLDHSSIDKLRSYVLQVYPEAPPHFCLTYFDADKDEISLSSDEDIAIMLAANAKTTKVFIKENLKEELDFDSYATVAVNVEEQRPREEEKKETGCEEKGEVRKEERGEVEKEGAGEEKKKQVIEGAQKLKESRPADNPIEHKPVDNLIESKPAEAAPKLIVHSSEERDSLPPKKPIIPEDRPLAPKIQPELIYHQAICNSCRDEYGIIGIKYSCVLCDDFNLCEKCEGSVDHPHALLKVKRPELNIKKEDLMRKYRKGGIWPEKKEEPKHTAAFYKYLQTAKNIVNEAHEGTKKKLEEAFNAMTKNEPEKPKPHLNPYLYSNSNSQIPYIAKPNPMFYSGPDSFAPASTKADYICRSLNLPQAQYNAVRNLCEMYPNQSVQNLMDIYTSGRYQYR